MTYPATPDFIAPLDDAAWWQDSITAPDGTQQLVVCSTNGRAFVDQLQSSLGVTVDGKWGANTSAALLARLQAGGADPNLITGVQAEAQLQRVGPLSLRGAIFFTHSLSGYGDAPQGITVANINVPTGTVLPVWNTAASPSPGGDIIPSCGIVNSAPPGSPPVTPTVPTAPAPSLSLGTIDLGAAADVIPLGILLAVVATVGLVAWFSWGRSGESSPSTRASRVRVRNPRRSRSRRSRRA